jgi:hypothetical protein
MVMIHLHSKFHMPVSSGSLVVAMKPKTKLDLVQNYCHTRTSFHYHILSVASVASTSQLRASAIVVITDGRKLIIPL